jgi:L-seryl-tRNA(Ser) seleniumtransferase
MDVHERLSQVPAVDTLLGSPALGAALARFGRRAVTDAVRHVLAEVREVLRRDDGAAPLEALVSTEAIAVRVQEYLERATRPGLRRAINATGIVLHTGLGRAVLPSAALRAIEAELARYALLQVSQETGERSLREGPVEKLLQQITGCEAATVVNNNAAATALVLRVLAQGKEVVVSRGQLVEIGGSFRIPEVMAESGATLVEVGTTNRTHLRDYARAINERTAALLRVHPSNYRVYGFTAEVPIADLVALGHEHRLPVIDDLGSGALIDLTRFGLPYEPTVQASLRAGADLVTFSADKLIGGPQGGVIVGKKEYVGRLRAHPMARIVRVGKLTLVALEATLRLFLDEEKLLAQHPSIGMMREPVAAIARRARRLAGAIRARLAHAEVAVVAADSQLGSGSLPTHDLPSRAVAVTLPPLSADTLAERLRLSEPPVFARIQEGRVLLDLRTIAADELREVVEALGAIGEEGGRG